LSFSLFHDILLFAGNINRPIRALPLPEPKAS
jgi:hypothetical protein